MPQSLRLNQYIAHCGICTRREADKLIKAGKVRVNDQVVLNPARRVLEKETVFLDDKSIKPEAWEYILLNKGKGTLEIIHQKIPSLSKPDLTPIDYQGDNSLGLLLYTSDTTLLDRIKEDKTLTQLFSIETSEPINEAQQKTLSKNESILELAILDDSKKKLGLKTKGITIPDVQEIFKNENIELIQLDRAMYSVLTKKDLPRNRWRMLSNTEIRNLKHFSLMH